MTATEFTLFAMGAAALISGLGGFCLGFLVRTWLGFQDVRDIEQWWREDKVQ